MKLLYFTAGWCGPCIAFGPTMKKVGEKIPVEKIDIDDNADLSMKYKIRGVPTVIKVDGDKEISRFSGGKTEKEVLDFFND